MRVLLGVSGGIAAIKSPDIVRRLRERGHEVRCAVTPNAGAFVAPLALEVLSGNAVLREQYLELNDSGRELHIETARWAEVLCVAPATCNILARLSLGLADDFLTTTALAFERTMIVAPAMSTEMWKKPIVQQHLETLEARGVLRIGPVAGPLATGETGAGRMAEPAEIVQAIEDAVRARDLSGKTVLVTAGPTREPIDPVRFLSNRSSGRMGFSLAQAAARRGARTLLVTGPVGLATPAGVERFDVETAVEMQTCLEQLGVGADLVIMTAAVADFRPAATIPQKLKKRQGPPEIVLQPNPDLLAGLATIAPQALRVGFAAETSDLEREASQKLESKQAHFIVANDVSRVDIGFEAEDNEVLVLRRDGEPLFLPRQSKARLANTLLDLFVEALQQREGEIVTSPR